MVASTKVYDNELLCFKVDIGGTTPLKHIGFWVKIEKNTKMANIVKIIYAFIVHIYGYFMMYDSFHSALKSILVDNNNNNKKTIACIFNIHNRGINT